jgi:CRP/FNR family transcriptional regulator, cyclic AMP receptor protein
MTEQIETILAAHPFFKGLSTDHIKTIAEGSRRVSYNVGEFLMREDEPGACFFLILHGKVALEVYTPERGPVIVSTLVENDVLGYCWLIPPYQCRFDLRAVELTRAICVDGNRLRKICDENHQIGYELLKRTTQMMSGLIEATRVQLLDVYGNH